MTTSVATIGQSENVTNDMITSSKDDVITDEDVNDRPQFSNREMRFLLKNYVTMTEYSYVFNSFVATKTVSLVATGGLGGARLVCRPSGYVVC